MRRIKAGVKEGSRKIVKERVTQQNWDLWGQPGQEGFILQSS